jgi:CRP-like cAMP-binding protein
MLRDSANRYASLEKFGEFLEPGDTLGNTIFDEDAYLRDKSVCNNVVALTDCLVAQITQKQFL